MSFPKIPSLFFPHCFRRTSLTHFVEQGAVESRPSCLRSTVTGALITDVTVGNGRKKMKVFLETLSIHRFPLPRILLGTPGAESMVFPFLRKVSAKSSENPLGFSWHKRVAWEWKEQKNLHSFSRKSKIVTNEPSHPQRNRLS